VIELRGVSKRFGAVTALEGIDLEARPGEVLGLLGDNGAGKSTLIKILSGFHEPSSGEIRIDGKPVRFRSPREARSLGVETVYQDLGLVEDLSIARNFFLGAELKRWRFALDLDRMNRIAREALVETGVRSGTPRRPCETFREANARPSQSGEPGTSAGAS
jgi:simple sugar transport system ATP-binding protein